MLRATALTLLCWGLLCSLATPVAAITIDTVPVGDVGNLNDPASGNIYGSVSYAFRMGKYEVTNAQYVAFLNAKATADPFNLYSGAQGVDPNGGITRTGSSGSYSYAPRAGAANKPVVFVDWLSAARFTNWLNNGQGNGDTESGAYTILGGANVTNLATITRNPAATWVLPTESEWRKAAFYQPSNQGGDTDSYWNYATRTNTAPASAMPPGASAPNAANVGNFFFDDFVANGYNNGYAINGQTFLPGISPFTDVGAYTAASSFYGTFDQNGNALEWTERFAGSNNHGLVGGSAVNGGNALGEMSASNVGSGNGAGPMFGFRVAAVPEPSTLALALCCGVGAIFVLIQRNKVG